MQAALKLNLLLVVQTSLCFELENYFPVPDRSEMNAVEIYDTRQDFIDFQSSLDLATKFFISTTETEYFCYKTISSFDEKPTDLIVVLPDTPKALETIGTGDNSLTQVKEEKEDLTPLQKRTKLLRHHFQGKCYEKKIKYWTYRVCPFVSVQQVRYESTGITKSTMSPVKVITLGKYEENDINEDEVGFSQLYVSGDGGREVVVRFECSKKRQQRLGAVTSVEEPSPLQYEIIFQTTLLCDDDFDMSLVPGGNGDENMSLEASTLRNIIRNERSNCLYLNQGYWDYELCFNKHVRQSHLKSKTKKHDYYLGKFKQRPIVETSHKGKKALMELFVDGSMCDLTGEGRQVEIVYLCSEKSKFKTAILDIEETSTCHYVLTVGVYGLCTLDGFSGGSRAQDDLPLQKTLCFLTELVVSM
eukprot:maker-scaffold_1-snap-gene-19.31-mRNA-1 protein AED:0.27 eAED:0.27 QI:150/1/1/1/1/1/2/197/415